MTEQAAEKIDASLVKAFVYSTKNVLSTMAGVDVELGKPSLRHNSQPSYDVSGIVGFTGDVMGNVVVSFTGETADNIVESFCGEKITQQSEDYSDAIGELCNMIAGNAKKEFGLNAGIGIPSVVIGTGHMIARMSDVPCVLIPCKCDAGNFAVEVNIKQVACLTAEVK